VKALTALAHDLRPATECKSPLTSGCFVLALLIVSSFTTWVCNVVEQVPILSMALSGAQPPGQQAKSATHLPATAALLRSRRTLCADRTPFLISENECRQWLRKVSGRVAKIDPR
jgi:hypothetical protein